MHLTNSISDAVHSLANGFSKISLHNDQDVAMELDNISKDIMRMNLQENLSASLLDSENRHAPPPAPYSPVLPASDPASTFDRIVHFLPMDNHSAGAARMCQPPDKYERLWLLNHQFDTHMREANWFKNSI